MTRAPRPTDFPLTVEDVGTFVFARKAMREQVSIAVEYARLTEGVPEVVEILGDIPEAMATIKVLTVSAPEGWDADTLDPEDKESYEKIMKVWGALRDKLAGFRKSKHHGSEGEGEGQI